VPRQFSDALRKRMAQAEPAPYRVASLEPTVPYQRPPEKNRPHWSAEILGISYLGNNPRTDEPFLNVTNGDRRGHRGLGGKVFWQDETYNDNRVLMHVPEISMSQTGRDRVFFHGNGATLERDVRDRQLVPQQISDAGVNAVLLAPQLAVDAADSSAGKFWQRGGLKRFVTESSEHLARLYGDPGTAKAFANMRSSSSATAAALCRRPGASKWAASATACAAVPARRGVWRARQCSHPGLSTTGPAFLSAPIRVTQAPR